MSHEKRTQFKEVLCVLAIFTIGLLLMRGCIIPRKDSSGPLSTENH